MCSLWVTKIVVLGTRSSYGWGEIESFWGGMERVTVRRKCGIIKGFKQRKDIKFDMQVLRSRKWIGEDIMEAERPI